MKFKRILVALDDDDCSQKTLEYAKELADLYKSEVALVTIISPTSPVAYGADPLLGQQPIIVPEVSEIEQQGAQTYLERVSKEFDSANGVYIFNRIGNVKDEIISTAHEWDADLIIMGTNGRTGFDLFLSGSVSESVVRHAKCPVLVVPGKCK